MGLKRKFTLFFDMPPDAFGDEARVTIVGREELLLEGRHRLIVCDGQRAAFSTVSGRLCIDGEGLYLSQMQTGQTSIRGRIDEISYIR